MIKKYCFVLVIVLSLLIMLLPASGVANAKSPKPQDQVKNFMNAAAGLKISKATGYCVAEERSNITSRLTGVPAGIKISLAKLKLAVTSQTADAAEVTATYTIKVQLKDQKKPQQSSLSDTFNLKMKMVNGIWLISGTTVLDKWAGLVAPSTPTATPTATATTTATPAPTTSGNPVKIGAINAWSGAGAMSGVAYGDPNIKLIEWQVKQQGGILGGRDVKIVRFDDGTAVANGVAGVTKLVLSDKVSAIVWGGISGAEMFAVSDECEKQQVLFVPIASVSPNGVADKKFTVEVMPGFQSMINPVVKLVTEGLKAKTVAFLITGGFEDKSTIRDRWQQGMKAAGIDIVYSDATSAGTQDFSPYLTRIKKANPDVLVMNEDSEYSVAIAKQMMDLGGWGKTKVIGLSQSASAAKFAGAEGWLIQTVWDPTLELPASKKFMEEFKTITNKTATPNYVFEYVPLLTAVEAIKFAGTDDPVAVAKAARSGNLEFDTPIGRAHVTTDGQGGLDYMWVQIQKGGSTALYNQ